LLANLKIGIVGLPGKWSTETLADSIEKKTGFRLIIDMDEVSLNLATMQLRYQKHDLNQLDGMIIKKISSHYCPNTLDRLELLRVAENSGVKIHSRPAQIQRLIDRLSCTVTLRNAGIPMPATRLTEDVNEAVKIVEEFGSAIFKPLYSTKARGMTVIESTLGKNKIRKAIEDFKSQNPMLYIQKKMALGGRDMGLMFLNGRYLGAYARVTKNQSWNTTINSGGSYALAEPSAEIIDLAHRAQAQFDLSYTTVDVAETEQGAVIFEVSAFGGFRGGKEGCNLNVADSYANFVINDLRQ
jgi:ATP-grasp enzyme of GAK system